MGPGGETALRDQRNDSVTLLPLLAKVQKAVNTASGKGSHISVSLFCINYFLKQNIQIGSFPLPRVVNHRSLAMAQGTPHHPSLPSSFVQCIPSHQPPPPTGVSPGFRGGDSEDQSSSELPWDRPLPQHTEGQTLCMGQELLNVSQSQPCNFGPVHLEDLIPHPQQPRVQLGRGRISHLLHVEACKGKQKNLTSEIKDMQLWHADRWVLFGGQGQVLIQGTLARAQTHTHSLIIPTQSHNWLYT